MSLVRVRRQGNSTVVTIAQEIMERVGLNDGDLVEETVDGRGRILIQPVSVEPRIGPKMSAAIKSSARDRRAVLKRLADHDRK